MSAEEQTPVEEPKKKGKGMMIVGMMLAVMAGVSGFLLPTLAPQLFTAEEAAGADVAKPRPKVTEFEFLEFGEVVVNLNLDRFNRYLKVKLTLQVAKDGKDDVEKLIEERNAMLKGWILSHLADKTMDEIRGAAGQNKLRREIHDQFNALLYTDGYDPIEDVFFEEFNVQ